jgi:putative transposase
MTDRAEKRGFSPECVLSDSRYAGVKNLKHIRNLSWSWLTRLKSDRPVNPDGKGNISISSADISETGTCVHLKGYGFIKVFRIVAEDGDTEYRATDDLDTDATQASSTS